MSLWQQIQPSDFTSSTRRQQLCDMITWCRENLVEDPQNLCDSVQDAIISDFLPPTEYDWIIKRTQADQGRQLLTMKPWDLAQYLAIFDFLYISRIFSKGSLEEILAPIARDDISILTNPDLRADQVCSHFCLRWVNFRFNIG